MEKEALYRKIVKNLDRMGVRELQLLYEISIRI